MAAQNIIIPPFGRQKPYATRLAQTSDHLPIPWAAGDPHLSHGSRVRKRRGRQLDRAGFQGAYLWDLHNVAAIYIVLSSIGVVSFPKSGALRIHFWSMVLSVILLVAGFFFYGKLLRAQAISSRPRTLMEKSEEVVLFPPFYL